MSIIFGLVGPNGRPADEDLDRMRRAYGDFPSDDSFMWCHDEVGMGVIQQRLTPESSHETFPQRSGCGCHIFISHARLDNRLELLRLLDVPPDTAPFIPDSALVAAAFERWGDAFAERLAGDWVAAVWSRDRRRLLIAMGPLANCSLFYTTEHPVFAFSSTIHGLTALPWVDAAPDINSFGYYFFTGTVHLVRESSLLRGIRSLPPGNMMILERGNTLVREFWNLEQVCPLRLRDDREYLEAFLEQYRRAVTCRLRSPGDVAATLSGGLDSGSVVALAAEILRPEGRQLPVFSSVPRFDLTGCIPPGRCGDETPYIQATAETAGNVRVNFLQSEAVTPIAAISAITKAAGPIIGAVNSFWMLDVMLTCRRWGKKVLLTGQGGNSTVSWSGSGYWRDYLDSSSPCATITSLVRWARGLGARNSAKHLLKALLPDSGIAALMHLRKHSPPSKKYLAFTPFRSEYIRSLGLDQHFTRLDYHCLRRSREMRREFINMSAGVSARIWSQLAVVHGVDVRDPTMDKELVEFLVSIPEYLYCLDSMGRGLIRHGMADQLPDKVRHPLKRGLQGADIIHRIRESADEVFAVLDDLERCTTTREILDLSTMRKVADRARTEESPELTLLCGSVLCRGISAALFLKQYA